MASWNTIKEAVRALKGQMSKNERNAAKYQKKKERGPVKAFFHITKNENVPAIEQQGLLTNHPNANINSANHPFRKHGTDAGGVWVTTEPTAFPVYGTTIGGKNGNASARADALSTIKIEVPLPELAKMRAVQDPYGKNILRKGNDPRAIEKFGTWTGIDVPTTVLLNDVKPQWLKNIGYVEENAPSYRLIDTHYFPLINMEGSWRLDEGNPLRGLDKSRLRDYSGLTGHHHNNSQDAAKSPQRFVEDYLNRNRPISDRLPVFPKPDFLEVMAHMQGAHSGPKYVRDGIAEIPAPNEAKRYSHGFIPAQKWVEHYQNYVKPGELIDGKRRFIQFAPGAISRGIGRRVSITKPAQDIYDRNFNWNRYKKRLAEGHTPYDAARVAAPDYVLDWDNIVYHPVRGYGPKQVVINDLNTGAISRGGYSIDIVAEKEQADLRIAADIIRHKKIEARDYLSQNLGRQPTAEEIDNWARAGVFNAIESGDIDAPKILGDWSDKVDWNITDRLAEELFRRGI
jgi:hypothetical protein